MKSSSVCAAVACRDDAIAGRIGSTSPMHEGDDTGEAMAQTAEDCLRMLPEAAGAWAFTR